MILTRPVWWKRVKGDLECAALIEAYDVGAQSHEEAEISQLAAVACRVKLRAGRVGQRARYGSSEERRTFQVILFGCLGGGGWICVSWMGRSRGTGPLTICGRVHGSLLGLGLLDGLEKLCVDALGAGLMRGPEDASAQLGAVRLFAACTCAFCHCALELGLGGFGCGEGVECGCGRNVWQVTKFARGKVRRGILGGKRARLSISNHLLYPCAGAGAGARRLVTLAYRRPAFETCPRRESRRRSRRDIYNSCREACTEPRSSPCLCHPPRARPSWRKPPSLADRRKQEAGSGKQEAGKKQEPQAAADSPSCSHSRRTPPVRAPSSAAAAPMPSRADTVW
jgi:hypothetical protein